jgi:vitamin B12 transporter
MKRILIAFLFSFITCFALAQIEMDTVWLKNASVFAHKSELLITTQFADSLYYKNGFTWSTADWLQKQNLLYAKNYGANGIQTAGIRGLGAAQTAVLWNGVPINNAMLGVADLSLIKGFFVDEMSLSLGSSGALFGNAAVGGTLQLNNELIAQKKIQIVAAVGSLLQYHLGLKASYKLSNKVAAETRVLASTNYNSYSYTNLYKPGKPKENIVHAYEKSFGLLQQFNIKLKNNWEWNHRIWAQSQIRQLPPSMVQSASKASLDDKFVRYQTELTNITSSKKSTFNFAFGHEENYYSDTLANIFNNNNVTSFLANQQWDWNKKKGILTFKSTYYSAFGSSKNYKQTAQQAYINLSSKYSFYSRKTKGQISAAFLAAKGGYFPLTVFYSFNYKLLPTWVLYFATGNAFRLPTLNERFWQPGGNENIKPEKSLHMEFGIHKQAKKWGMKNHVYFTPTKNLVVWVPNGNGIVSPLNLSKQTAFICGNEFSSNQTINRKKWRFVLTESYHLNIAKTSSVNFIDLPQMPYVPLHRVSLELRVMYEKITFWYLQQFQSERNVSLVDDDKIDRFALGNVIVQWENKHASTSLQFNNIFNTQYQLLAVRPMPGFNLQLNFTYNINYKK